jgi:hypothetical protein
MSLSFYWLTTFPYFQKSSVQTREMYQAIGRGEFYFAVVKRVLQIQKHLVLSG